MSLRTLGTWAALALGLLTMPLAAVAQQAAMPTRIGLLWQGASPPAPPRMQAFRDGLQESGWSVGQNISIELRHAESQERLRELAAELVQLNVSVIATFGDLAPRAAQASTEVVPIVALTDDFVGSGIGASLARPGGNTTGVTILSPELSAKRVQLLREILPKMSRVAALWDPATPSQRRAAEEAARSLSVKLQVLELRGREDVPGAFHAAKRGRAEALNILASPVLSSLTPAIIARAAEQRIPAIYQWREHAQAGGLMSYGPSLYAMWRQTALVVGKILNGAKPSDLPVEQPTTFELVINLKTAKALGLTIPPSLLLRADEVIE